MNNSGKKMDDTSKRRLQRNTWIKRLDHKIQKSQVTKPYNIDARYRKRLQNDEELQIKNFKQFIIDGRTPAVLPVAGTATDILKEAYNNYLKGNYKKASGKFMVAFAIILSYMPCAKGDRGLSALIDVKPGLLNAPANPNIMLSYHDKRLLPKENREPIAFTRKQRRRRNRRQKREEKKKEKKEKHEASKIKMTKKRPRKKGSNFSLRRHNKGGKNTRRKNKTRRKR